MGACVVVKPKNKQSNLIKNTNEPLKDLETRQFAQFHDKKTTRGFNKQSQEQIKKFLEAEHIVHDILITQTTKQPESNIHQVKRKTDKISLKSMTSFCQSVQKEFEVFQTFTQSEKQQAYFFLKNNVNQKAQDLDQTSQIERDEGILIDEVTQILMTKTPSFLRKYLPLQEYSIQIEYL